MNDEIRMTNDESKRKIEFGISKLICHSSFVIRISLAGLLAGCMVGPDFKSPQRRMPQSWVGATPTTAPTMRGSMTTPVAADVSQWWANFNDPELESLVTRAIQSNLDLKLAESRLRQAQAQRGVVFAGLVPQANLNGSYAHTGTEGAGRQIVTSNGVVEGASSSRTRDIWQAGLDASWELDFFGGIRRDLEAANADIVAADEDRRDVMVTITSEVALNYLNYRGLQQQLVIARENLDAQEKSADVTRRRQQFGFISALDVANANALVASTKAQIPVLQQQAQQTIYDIALLLGMEPDALIKELTAPATIPVTPPTVPVGMPSDLLRRRPDIRRAEARLHAATARVGVATADLFPKFSLTGSVGTSGPTGPSILNWDNGVWSIGAGLTYPLFSAGRIRANIRVQNELESQAATTYEQTVLTALRDVESSLIAYAREQQHRDALVEAVAADRRAVDLAMQLYTQGQTDFLNVVTAQRALYGGQDALVQSERTIATNLVTLYKSLGGGWEAELSQKQ